MNPFSSSSHGLTSGPQLPKTTCDWPGLPFFLYLFLFEFRNGSLIGIRERKKQKGKQLSVFSSEGEGTSERKRPWPSPPFYARLLVLDNWPAHNLRFTQVNDHSWFSSLNRGRDEVSCALKPGCCPLSGVLGGVAPLERSKGRAGIPRTGSLCMPQLQEKVLHPRTSSWATNLWRPAQQRCLLYALIILLAVFVTFPIQSLEVHHCPR